VVSKPMDFAPTCHILLSNHGEIHQLAGCPWSSHVGPPQKSGAFAVFPIFFTVFAFVPHSSAQKSMEGVQSRRRPGPAQGRHSDTGPSKLWAIPHSLGARSGTRRREAAPLKADRRNVNLNWDDGWFRIEMDTEWEYTVPMVIFNEWWSSYWFSLEQLASWRS
jgi:hypothetical protein